MPYLERAAEAAILNPFDTASAAAPPADLPGSHAAAAPDTAVGPETVNFAWLEVTGNCQEMCAHCYAASGPEGTHGTMTVEEWKSTIDQLAEQGTGMVQFIGGEPTRHPGLPELVEHALSRDMIVEVYTNMVHIPQRLKDLFIQRKDRISLATSYYSPDPAVHREITGRNTQKSIRKNIQWAASVGIELRVGIISVQEGQDIGGAKTELIEMGVNPDRIGVDHLRQVGRGVRDEVTPETTSQLCGNCADGVLAVLPDGSVKPCVFSRQTEFQIGNVRDQRLAEILGGGRFAGVRGLLREAFANRGATACKPCRPDCTPNCKPSAGTPCGPECKPRGLSAGVLFEEEGLTDRKPWDFVLSTDGQVSSPVNKCEPRDPCAPHAEKCNPKKPSCNPCIPNHRCTPDRRCDPHYD